MLISLARSTFVYTLTSHAHPGHNLTRRDGTILHVKEGIPMQLLISHANRDNRVFSNPCAILYFTVLYHSILYGIIP